MYAGAKASAQRLETDPCSTIVLGESSRLSVGSRYLVSTGDEDLASRGDSVVYAAQPDGSWTIVAFDGAPAAFQDTMTLAALLALLVPDALPDTAAALTAPAAERQLPLVLVFGLTFGAGLIHLGRRYRAWGV